MKHYNIKIWIVYLAIYGTEQLFNTKLLNMAAKLLKLRDYERWS